MLRNFLKRLLGETPEGEVMQEDEARIAMAAVLVRAAKADDDYAEIEKTVIDQVLTERYGLSAAQAAMLRSEGEMAEAEAVDLVSFTRVIKQSVPYEERISVIEALWRVVLADASRDPFEDALVRQGLSLLGISDMDGALARQRVSHRSGDEE